MNRAQRRQQERIINHQKKTGNKAPDQFANVSPDFSSVPLVTMCQSIQLLINELKNRGFSIYDFENKEKSLQQIQIIGEKIYFLAAEEEVNADVGQKTDNGV